MTKLSLKVGDQELILETGRMAKQANGAVFASYGESSVLATACCGSSTVDDLDYVPLSVEYNEKYYAAGKIPGGFLKREGRPREREILSSRLIDRPMRPLFEKAFKRDLQVVPTVVATDQVNPPDVVAIVASSAAVHISDIPFHGPVGAVRVGVVDGNIMINPTYEQLQSSVLDIIVAGTQKGITMVEGGAKQVSEELLLEAIEAARGPINQLCQLQEELRQQVGKEKLALPPAEEPLAQAEEIRSKYLEQLREACFVKGKFERYAAIDVVRKAAWEEYAEIVGEENKKKFNGVFEKMEQETLRQSIIRDKVRTDGRSPVDIRNISCEVGVLPRTHGSSLFTRGETQALVVATLGTIFDEQIMDDIEGDRREHFLLHYNFPPFSVGETGRMGTGRREIGHGHLAHRAVMGVLPEKKDFPYTLRIVSEILESNGSSSMATVCGASMSLQEAGVPLIKPVAGIAMGLVKEGDDVVVLSDILGEEDHLGDMDFKVAGTEDGITAFQMDIKIDNVSPDIMKVALEQAHKGRLHILGKMGEAISQPKDEVSDYAPRIVTFKVAQDNIGALIGPGGKMIKAVSEAHEVRVNIEDDGTVTVYSKNRENGENAKAAFMALLEEPEVGKVYQGTVKRIEPYGAFIEFLPGKEGLCHISRMSAERINKVEDVLELNQKIDVRIVEIDKLGRVNLSLIYEESNRAPREDRPRDDRPRDDRPRHGGDRHGGDRGDRRGPRNNNRR